jgi:hypothetical protein
MTFTSCTSFFFNHSLKAIISTIKGSIKGSE